MTPIQKAMTDKLPTHMVIFLAVGDMLILD
jgi:hypothetical protein